MKGDRNILSRLGIAYMLLMLVSVNSGSIEVTITCQPCTMSCSYSRCLQVSSSDGYNTQVCPSYQCDTGLNSVVIVSKCSTSSNGQACSTELCYTSSISSACASKFGVSISCNPGFWFYTSCPTCSVDSFGSACKSGKCISSFSNYSSSTSMSICIDSCNGVPTTNASVFSCPGGVD